jgi:hypothetical protein
MTLTTGEIAAASASCCLSYFMGALRDGTFNRRHGTWRLSHKNTDWLGLVQLVLERLGARGWIYREGKDRSVWVLETCLRSSSGRPISEERHENAAFIRGYFDAEGGIPLNSSARFYIQPAQKNKEDLEDLRRRMLKLGLMCRQWSKEREVSGGARQASRSSVQLFLSPSTRARSF